MTSCDTEAFADRVDEVRSATAAMRDCESPAELYGDVVERSRALFDCDAAIVCRVEDGRLVPESAIADELRPTAAFRPADAGLAGSVLRRDESLVVDDLQANEDAEPISDRYRSAMTIPVGDGIVFQALSTEPAAFTGDDLRLGELLLAQARNEDRRLELSRSLGEERDRFAALFENVSDAAVQYRIDDGDVLVDAVNSAFLSTFGYDSDAVVGTPVDELLVPDDDEIDDPVERCVVRDEATHLDRDVEVERETDDGRRPFLFRTVPIAGDDDRGYLIYTDVSALKARERELREKNERLDQFASIVSHDLRNPINVASGYLELLADEYDPAHVEEARTAIERMDNLVDDVLTLAREGESVDPRTVELERLARDAWRTVETEGVRLEIADDATLEADPERSLQLFENLFRNAVEHGSTSSQSGNRPDDAEDGSSELTVTVGTIESSTELEEETTGTVYVEDDGVGFDMDVDEIFEPGTTSGDDGTGLGLSIVRDVATAHGWTVSATERAEGGARFEFDDVMFVPIRRDRGS